jgi:small subunit ribosomal protein S21
MHRAAPPSLFAVTRVALEGKVAQDGQAKRWTSEGDSGNRPPRVGATFPRPFVLSATSTIGGRSPVQVLVRDNNVDQALRALKKKMQREGVFREMKLRGHYEKPSERKAREKAEAVRRARKLIRKKMQREGLLPSKPKPSR